jgi:aminoglycoside 3-N-acetyltransferase
MLSEQTFYTDITATLGLQPTDTIWVASDLSGITLRALRSGIRFDPGTFIDNLQKTLSKGTLLIPAFVSQRNAIPSFDLRETAPETGALSMTAFKRSDFVRTADPFHSFLVWGKDANELAGLSNKSTFGADSVFGFLHRKNAKMLLIDIDLRHSFTFAHYVEEQEHVSYRHLKNYTIQYKGMEGEYSKKEFQFFEKKSGVSLELSGLRNIFLANGAAREIRINDSVFTLIDLQKSYELIRNDIRDNDSRNLHKTNRMLFVKELLKQFIQNLK